MSSEASTGYTAKKYSDVLLVELYATTVGGDIANTDYEEKLSDGGDSVTIGGMPDVAVDDYVIGQGLTYQTPTPAETQLNIDKAKSWALSLNDVQRKQSHLNYGPKWTAHAAKKLGRTVDVDLLGNVYSDVHASNTGATAGLDSGDINLGVSGTPFRVTPVNAPSVLTRWSLVLDEQDVPEEGRWAVIPPWFFECLQLSDLKSASLSGDDTSILRNGKVGRVANFELYKSNLLAKAADSTGPTCWNPIFGHSMALTFAAQMRKEETLKNPNDFGDLLRGLMVYGYKVVKPEAMGHGYVKK